MNSRTEELIRRCQDGDRDAGEVLLSENSGLIWSVAKRYLGRGAEADDLYQLGCLGFLKAVRGFDLDYGTQFSTYAVPKISGEIRRFLRDDGAIKVSRSIKEHAVTVKTARNLLLQNLGREPTLQELSQSTGLEPEEIALAEAATASTESIYKESGEDGFRLEHVLSDTQSEEAMLEKMALKQAIDRLCEKEQSVIKMRYYHGMTQERIARVLGVSQVQISRIEKKALGRLRNYLM